MPTNTENILTSATIEGSNSDLTFTVDTDGVLTIRMSSFDMTTTISTGFYTAGNYGTNGRTMETTPKDALLTLGRALLEASNQL